MIRHLQAAEGAFSDKLSRFLRLEGYRVITRIDTWWPGGSVYILKDQPPYLTLGPLIIPRPRLCIGRFWWEEKESQHVVLEIYGEKHYNSLCVLGDRVRHHLELRRVAPLQECPEPKLEFLGFIY